MLGQMWRGLPDEQKEVYKLRYQDEKEVFLAKKKAKLDSMTEAEKSQLKEEEELKRKRRATRSDRKLKRSLNKPIAEDVNPYILFFKSKVLERGDAPISQYMKGVSEHWKRMPIEDKQPFIEKAKSNSLAYQKKLSAWEHKMISEGHSSLVRRSAFRSVTKRRRVTKLSPTNKTTGKNKNIETDGKMMYTESKSSSGKTTNKPASKASMEGERERSKAKDNKQNK